MSGDRVPPLKDRPLYRRLLEPGSALVSENFAGLNGVKVGSTIVLPGENGPVSLKVVGTIVDFSNNRGTIVVDRQGIGKAFGTSAVDIFAVGLIDHSEADAACQAINRSSWAAENAAEAMTHEALRGHILGMIGRLYGVAYVQEIVAAAVAALGVSASMLICVAQRRRELGLLRALGATSHQVFITVIAEAAAMALIGAGLGAVLGFALEWYVLRVILLVETGFNFPVLLPLADALLISVVIGVAAIVSGLAPALSASRMGIGSGLARE
jgi:putative ABC transport system permease protein